MTGIIQNGCEVNRRTLVKDLTNYLSERMPFENLSPMEQEDTVATICEAAKYLKALQDIWFAADRVDEHGQIGYVHFDKITWKNGRLPEA